MSAERQGMSLEGRGIRKAFGTGFALDIGEIAIPAGETVAVLGPSGSGKSTLMFILGLLDKPDAGTVLLDGREVGVGDRSARMDMAAVFQRPYLMKGSVGANVAYGLDLRHVPKPERDQRVAEALDRVGLAGYEKRSASSLSGGEAQRASLARALVLRPRVLLLDEPLASLDPVLKQRLAREFGGILRAEGVTGVWVTHDQDEALAVASLVAVMNHGKIVSFGPAEEVMGLPTDTWAASFLGVEPAEEGVVRASEGGLVTITQDGACVEAYGAAPVGAEVLFSVRPEDVMLFESGTEFPVTTARNRIAAVVSSVSLHGSTARVTLEADGLQLASTVSRASVRELKLAEGSHVLAVFKASAVSWKVAEPVASSVIP